jgi:hypothetical protein
MNTKPDIATARSVQVHVSDGVDLGAQPLAPGERALADDSARRLRLELRGLMELLPESERGASAMARVLEIDRNTCQRIVAATGRGDADASMLVQLPGVMGLRQFLEAMGRRFPTSEAEQAIAGARAAVDKFEKLIDDLAGSQRKLRERLEMDRDLAGAGADAPGASDNLATRRAMFRAAVDVVGRWSETRLTMRIIRPAPGDPMHTENIRMTGHVGHMARPVAVPLEVYSGTPGHLVERTGPAFQSLDASQSVGDTPNFLMTEFCTRPLPRVTSRATENRVIHVIDEQAEPGLGGRPSDIFVADRRAGVDKHPATQHPPIGEISTIMNFPSRRYVMDVYLHRDIARRCIPSLEVHLASPWAGQALLARWSTRLPGGPKLELLGVGLEHAGSDAYPRHAEVATHMFKSVGWDPGEFVGYRCDVAYPIWRAAYCVLFDFTGNELPRPIGRDEGK